MEASRPSAIEKEAPVVYISIRRYAEVARNDELMRKVEKGLLPIIRESPGCKAYYSLDAGDGVVASISTFETEQRAKDSDAKAAAWVQGNRAEGVPEPPEITAGPVQFSISA
jgi:hypothetical protein